MDLKPSWPLDTDSAEQLAGVAGLGWTTSTLGFLGTALGYGNSVVSRLVTEPSSLLYVGVVCFLATLGLDRAANRATDEGRARSEDEASSDATEQSQEERSASA